MRKLDGLFQREVFRGIFFVSIFTIPLSQFFAIRLLIVSLLYSFFFQRKGGTLIHFFKQCWDILLYLAILSIGLIYSDDVGLGLRVMETNFSFLAIPLVLYKLQPLELKTRDRIFQAFLFGVVVSSLVCFSFAVFRYSSDPNIQFFFFETFTEVIQSHPTYLAYYIIFSITIELYSLYHSKYQHNLLLRYLIVAFLFVILILTGGQTAFISMLFVFSFFILKFLTEGWNRDRKLVIVGVGIMLLCMFVVSLVEKNNRLLEVNDSWERATLWKSAIAANSNILLGVGTGDYKVALNEYYSTHNMSSFASESYNAHNQFIQILFSNGILGLMSLIIMMGRSLYLGMKTNNILAILCLFPFLIYGITEVFLGRFQGVVFFALLHQVFFSEMISSNRVGRVHKISNELDVKPV